MRLHEQFAEAVKPYTEKRILAQTVRKSGLAYDTIRRVTHGNASMYSAEMLAEALGKKILLVDADEQKRASDRLS